MIVSLRERKERSQLYPRNTPHIDEKMSKKMGKGWCDSLYLVVSTGKRSMFTLPSDIHSFLTSLWRSV